MVDVRAMYGFLVSAGFHAVVVGLLALGTFGPPRGEPRMLVVSQWSSHDPVESVEFEVPAPVLAACEFPVVGPATADPIAVTVGDLNRLVRGDLPTPADDDVWGLGLPGGLLSASGGGGGGVEEGGATFFGTTVPGTRFVYVVDASRSMAGTRFRKAKRELFRSVSNLRPDQQHYVIFFGYDTYPMYFPEPCPSLVPSIPESWKRLSRWMRHVDPNTQPATNGRTAVLMALAFEPDAVYLLSDGVFTDDTVPTLLTIHDNEIPIHTIAFGNEDARRDLRRIAEVHEGTYRFVR
ncbi:MAG TPA: VWA domain-containing protein [Thermoguttaceae bacterium]|nr:VWA domain-containing protein [Thermoguttaceae bacterium]